MKSLNKLNKVLSNEYIRALTKLVENLIGSNLSVSTIILIGSPMHSEKIIHSDLDVCIYIDKIKDSKKLLDLITKTLQLNQLYILEEPTFISDFHNKRVECSIRMNNVNFELAFLDGNIHTETIPHLIGKDNFERHIGNLFKYGIVLYNLKNSKYAQLKHTYLPYYPEKLRKIRLGTLEQAIQNTIVSFSKQDNLTQLVILNRLLVLLVQYIFIKRKIYPYHYEKWLEKQFKELLNDKKTYSLLKKLYVAKTSNSLENIFLEIKLSK